MMTTTLKWYHITHIEWCRSEITRVVVAFICMRLRWNIVNERQINDSKDSIGLFQWHIFNPIHHQQTSNKRFYYALIIKLDLICWMIWLVTEFAFYIKYQPLYTTLYYVIYIFFYKYRTVIWISKLVSHYQHNFAM